MTKIAIISQAEQGVLIDISGCSSLNEAKQYLTSTLQVSSQFWEGLIVDLNLGPLVLTPEQVNEIQAIVSDVGVHPRQIFSLSPITRASLIQCRLPMAFSAAADAPLTSVAAGSLQVESAAVQDEPNELELKVHEIAVLEKEQFAWITEPVQAAARDDSDQMKGGSSSLPDLFLQARQGVSAASSEAVLPLVSESFVVDQAIPQMPPMDVSLHSSLAVLKNTSKAVQKSANSQSLSTANKPPNPQVLMMKQTLRSGQRVCHKGHLVIIGDVNPGAEIVADGDITVWGALRGMAHAGASGNTQAEIRALKFEPIQLRIAQAIARSPDRSKLSGITSAGPETARVIDGKIRIAVNELE